MYSVDARRTASVDDLMLIKIGRCRGRTFKQDSFIGHADMRSMTILMRINGDTFYAHCAQRAHDAAGYLSSICNKYFSEHEVDPQMLL
jgi:hypothetical protein